MVFYMIGQDVENSKIGSALEIISQDPNYKVLKRVSEKFEKVTSSSRTYSAMIIDLETMGLDPKAHAIIEIGLLKFSFTDEDGIIEVQHTYNAFSDPHVPIPEEIKKITGITLADVEGKTIDWQLVSELLADCDMVICHNSKFDRKFLEIQTPDFIQMLIKKKSFACTIQDINWSNRGYENSKLDYLNWKLGFFYDGHRALNDCWATLNLLCQETGAFAELRNNMKKSEILLWAIAAPFGKKDPLKEKKYKFSDAPQNMPKCWQKEIENEAALEEEIIFLENEVYCRKGACNNLPIAKITAQNRYSFRAQASSLRLSEMFPGLTRSPQRAHQPLTEPASTFIVSTTSFKKR